MNAVVKLPERNRGCWTSADWKAMLEAVPRMTNELSASRMRRIAPSRVSPWVTSFAIIES